MLLVVDVGNTNLTTGLVRNGSLLAVRRASTPRRPTPDELELVLEGLLRLDDAALADVGALSVASVVPSITEALESVARRRERPLLVATAGTVPIPIRVDGPAEVGADRLVNALAAVRLHGAPAVVVDIGTATTFDCVAADGAFVGGAIAAGPALGLEALAAGTASLPRIDVRAPDRAVGRNTREALEVGAILGHQALVGGLLRLIRLELATDAGLEPEAVTALLTGGFANTVWARAIDGIDAIDPELTLKGLAILHAEVADGERLSLGLA